MKAALPTATRRTVNGWTAIAVVAAGAAAIVCLAAGGSSVWLRWITGVVSIGAFVNATRFRTTLVPGVVTALLGAALLPQDATFDRGIVAAAVATLVVVAAEAAALARRSITIAPIASTRREIATLAIHTALTVLACTIVAIVAQLDRFGWRWLVVGIPIAGIGVLIALAPKPSSGPPPAPGGFSR